MPELTTLTQAVALIFIGFATAIAALLWMSTRPGRKSTAVAADDPGPDIAFLFDGQDLVDATEAGRRLLGLTEPDGTDMMRLTKFLAPRFPGLHDGTMACTETDLIEFAATDGRALLRMQSGEGRLRLTLHDTPGATPALAPDRHSLAALTDELRMHRTLTHGTPFPVWRQAEDGRILWANAEYHRLAERLGATDPDLAAPPAIFDVDAPPADAPAPVQRARLELPREAEPRWFEFQINPLGGDLLVAAVPIDRVVRAESSLHDFVQTLTQTFAHLNVGLAVFNRNRELAIFNPALTDLLELQPEFLITRPSLFQLFDRLREQRLLPEPKDYKSWRRQMSALEAAASDGVHSETWSLFDGRTYRITGRPHPEGAVAFLFEDISAEISLERRFRAELQMGQAVIDGLDEAIAVFTPSGEQAMCNRAFGALWQARPGADISQMNFIEVSRRWQEECMPTPVWGDARDFAATLGERANWTAEVRLRDGRRLACRFDALPGGYTLAGFAETGLAALPLVPRVAESATA